MILQENDGLRDGDGAGYMGWLLGGPVPEVHQSKRIAVSEYTGLNVQ